MRTVCLFPLALLLVIACNKSDDKPTSEPANDQSKGDPPAAIDAAAEPKSDPPPAIADAAAAAMDAGADGQQANAPDGASDADPKAVPEPADKNAGPPKDLKVLPKKWSRKKVNDYMKKQFNRGLGVKCKFCHNTKDFAANTNKHKKISRDMYKMQTRLNKQYFGGKPKVTCYTCHKGKKEP